MNNCFLKYISVCLIFLLAVFDAPAVNRGDKFILVIDAGHGGKDAGAIGRITKEKNINLKVALAFGQLVEDNCSDVQVIYTRKSDVFVPLQERADIANNAKADLFISIHTNSLPKGRIAYGTETYTLGIARADENLEVAKRENSVILYENNYQQVYHGFDPNQVESYIIFELMQDQNMEQSVEMARCLQQQYVGHAGRRDKGVHQAGFLVLRNTSMPAVLTELGFISTPAEEKFLSSADGVQKLARSLYNGFRNYRRQYATKSNDFTPEVEDRTSTVDVETKTPVSEHPARVAQEVSNRQQSSRPVFKVQLLISERKLKTNDRRFKGLKSVDYYHEKGMYKYTYGSSTDYNEIRRKQKSVSGKFKGTFIVAFLNGERIDLAKALKMTKRK